MRLLYTTFLILIVFSSCQSQGNKVDNTQPMFGGVEKSEEHKKIDKDFIQECMNKYGSIESSVSTHIDHAWRYYYNNDLETAMKRFNQAWLLNPEYSDSYFGFASLLETKGLHTEANHYYKIGIEKDTKNDRAVKCYQRIADCKEQLNDIKGTISAYNKIANLDSNNSFAFKKIGYFQMQSGNANEAIKAYGKAIELDPKDAMTYNNRAYLYQTLKNYESAIKDYSKAIKLNPKYISALVNRGITEMQINQYKEAKADFKQCVTLDPKAGELRRFLGLAKLKLNEVSEACIDFRIALKLGDKSVYDLIKESCEK